MSDYLLVGDIGGTNTRLALHSASNADEGGGDALFVKHYLNSILVDDDDDEDDDSKSTSSSSTKKTIFERRILEPFLLEAFETINAPIDEATSIYATIAVAGPVSRNRANLTNLGSVVLDGVVLSSRTESPLSAVRSCGVINDFVAQGYGLLTLDLGSEAEELIVGSKGRIDPNGPKACVGCGTGLGQCYLTPSSSDGGSYACYPSEGGHVEYSPRSPLQSELNSYLRTKYGTPERISVERVVSGPGLASVFEFLCVKYPEKVDGDVLVEFENAEEMLRGKVVGVNAEKGDGLCREAMEIMCSAYGSEVGNAALKFLPTGGMYVAGGMTPKMMSYLRGPNSPFMKSYCDKGRVSKALDSIPLFAVFATDMGLRGARHRAAQDFAALRKET